MIAYLASPYSGSPELIAQRMEVFCRVDAKLMAKGIHTVSPLLKHFILQYEQLPNDWAYWEEYSKKLMSLAHKLIVICQEGFDSSTGVKAEIALARKLKLVITFLDISGEFLHEELPNG